MEFKITATKETRNKSKDPESVSLTVTAATTVAQLKTLIAKDLRVAPARQGLKVKNSEPEIRLSADKKTLGEYKVEKDAEVLVKDLGPQFDYRGVFLLEYLGPIVVMLFFALRPAFLYGPDAANQPYSFSAKVGLACWFGHYVKRELETLFVHKFSRATMPLSNLFKNSIYYWGFTAAIGYVLCNPLYTPVKEETTILAASAMAVFELINFYVHYVFSTMRTSDGDESRSPPAGILFRITLCPNYTAEVLAWVAFAFATNVLMAWVFAFAGFAQMTEWALKKKAGYVKSDPKLKSRPSIIPFVF